MEYNRSSRIVFEADAVECLQYHLLRIIEKLSKRLSEIGCGLLRFGGQMTGECIQT